MGAIVAVTGVVVLVVFIAVLWVTGATRPKSLQSKGAAKTGAAEARPAERAVGID
jgi:hypothetical protein